MVIPLTQDDIASLARTSRPTANRVLKAAEDDGILSVRRSRIEVLDADALDRRARQPPRTRHPARGALRVSPRAHPDCPDRHGRALPARRESPQYRSSLSVPPGPPGRYGGTTNPPR